MVVLAATGVCVAACGVGVAGLVVVKQNPDKVKAGVEKAGPHLARQRVLGRKPVTQRDSAY
ncbi:hypothetical protein [Kribbella endophytica]